MQPQPKNEQGPMPYWKAKAAVDQPVVRAEGVKAFQEHKSSYDCPYPYGTAIGDVWWEGYFAAREGRG